MAAPPNPEKPGPPPGGPQTVPGAGGRLTPWLATGAVLLVTTALLRLHGRRWWCAGGRLTPWSGDSQGPHNSQHLFDPYTFTHILHGIVFCGVLAWALPRLAPAWRLCFAVAAEALWEVVENSPFVIERYRAATAALGYQGDTVANSLGDILSCAVGFLLARRLGLWGSLGLFLVIEVALLVWIRDSLVLEVLMLVWSIDAIKQWQMGP